MIKTVNSERVLSRLSISAFVLALTSCSMAAEPPVLLRDAAMTEVPKNEIEISGVVVAGGAECPLFRTDDGRTFALASFSKSEAPVGTRMRLVGNVAEMSFCQQGTAFASTKRLD